MTEGEKLVEAVLNTKDEDLPGSWVKIVDLEMWEWYGHGKITQNSGRLTVIWNTNKRSKSGATTILVHWEFDRIYEFSNPEEARKGLEKRLSCPKKSGMLKALNSLEEWTEKTKEALEEGVKT